MNEELEKLQNILSRNTGEVVNISDEVNHYFFFDQIKDRQDLEDAWRIFPEHQEIRRRCDEVRRYQNCKSLADRGPVYGDYVSELIKSNILSLRKITPNRSEYKDVINFIDAGFSVEVVPEEVSLPEYSDNTLFSVLQEAVSDYLVDCTPRDKPHYELLMNWAIYLTKCDEVAAYILWSCLIHKGEYLPSLLDDSVKLWAMGGRDRYWIKDNDFCQAIIYLKV